MQKERGDMSTNTGTAPTAMIASAVATKGIDGNTMLRSAIVGKLPFKTFNLRTKDKRGTTQHAGEYIAQL
jgi:hypothetical protein